MAFNRRNWKGRQGTGLNKFSINGATPVTVVNQPDSITEQGDALSAGNLNDLEQRIADGFDSASGELADAVEELESADTDLKSAINSNSNRISNLEQKAGSYSTVQYRGTNAVPTGKAKYGLVESIVGKSRAWNQLMSTTFEYYACSNGGVVDGVYTINNITDPLAQFYQISTAVPQGHVSLVHFMFKPTKNVQINISLGGANYGTKNCTANVWNECDFLITMASNMSEISLYVNKDGALDSSDTVQVKDFLCRDLTLIFPEGVPSTVAECVAKCPDILKYDAYGTSMVDTTVEGVESVGVNIWDEEWEIATLGGNTCVASKNMIPVNPYKAYYIYDSTNYVANYGVIVVEYNSNGTFVAQGRYYSPTITLNSATAYIKFGFITGYYGSIYNHDIQLAYDSSPTKTTYHAYHAPVSLSLPNPVTLKSAGSVAEEYDLETGEKTNPISDTAVNLASLSWTLDDNRWWASAPADIKIPATNNDVADILCAEFVARSVNDMYVNGGTGIGVASNGRFYCHNGSTTTPPTGTVIYALATPLAPTQLTPVIDNTIQTEGGGTINTIQTQTPVIDNSLDVGYLAL